MLTDNDSLDEFRFSDGAGTVPIRIPVSAGETFVLSLEFENTNSDSIFTDPSVVNDAADCKPSRNAIYAQATPTFQWIDACSLISGDWVLRAVVDCAADVGIFTDGFESGDATAWSASVP